MILSQTARYALMAVYYLATLPDDDCRLTKDIAMKTKIPAAYLARIMSTLAKRGILYSRTGLGGGFCLTKEAMAFTLYDVASQFDNLDDYQGCIFGFAECCKEKYCPLHDDWMRLKNDIIAVLKSTNLGKLRQVGAEFDWSKVNV
jgi:Rrf2 family iron-sulfur cluster assembly transcriptional regulator